MSAMRSSRIDASTAFYYCKDREGEVRMETDLNFLLGQSYSLHDLQTRGLVWFGVLIVFGFEDSLVFGAVCRKISH